LFCKSREKRILKKREKRNKMEGRTIKKGERK